MYIHERDNWTTFKWLPLVPNELRFHVSRIVYLDNYRFLSTSQGATPWCLSVRYLAAFSVK